jgi:hypothetical protein
VAITYAKTRGIGFSSLHFASLGHVSRLRDGLGSEQRVQHAPDASVPIDIPGLDFVHWPKRRPKRVQEVRSPIIIWDFGKLVMRIGEDRRVFDVMN